MVAEEVQFHQGIEVRLIGIVDAQEAIRREKGLQLCKRVVGAMLALLRLGVDLFITGEEVDDPVQRQKTDGIIGTGGQAAQRNGELQRLLLDPLTQRELDVLLLIFKGVSDQQIDTSLQLAQATVKVHVKNILTKLDAQNRSQAVSEALRRGILHRD